MRPGTAVAVPTGGVLPDGADAVVMVEHTQQTMPGSVEVVRPAAPGDGTVRADEDVAAGDRIAPAGRPLRAQDLGMLAAAGVTTVEVHRRPRVGIVSTGDEVVPPSTPRCCCRGRSGTRPRRRWPGWCAGPAASRSRSASSATTPAALERVLRDAADPVRRGGGLGRVVGRCPGRDRRRGGPARGAGDPVPRARAATREADPAGRLRGSAGGRAARQPAVGAGRVPAARGPARPPGRRAPRSPPPEPTVRAGLDRQVPSQTGRLDVVQVTVEHRPDGAGGQPAVRRLGAAVGAHRRPTAGSSCPRRPPGCRPAPTVDVTLYR